jgi:peptidoglycan/LPS O-acetylase OafA/YrhL
MTRVDPEAELGPAEAVSAGGVGAPARHFRNLDIVRLIAASSVIFSHGFLIAQQTEANEPFKRLSGDILGLYGVYTFFIISGLLVTESWMAKPGTAGFLWRRFLRIVPGFLVCNALTLAIAGLWFYPGGLLHFLRDDWKTILKHCSYITSDGWFSGVQYYAPTPDHSEGELNGSTWTLQQELICYVLLALFAAARWLKPVFVGAGLLLATAALYLGKTGPEGVLENFLYGVAPFASGVLAWWLLKAGHRPRLPIVLACVAAMAVALPLHKLMFVFPPAAAYVVLWIGVAAPFDVKAPRWLGDVSYGVYLYGWPVQQMIKVAVGPGVTWKWTVFGGLASWWLVEKPALRMKGRVPADWSVEGAIARRWRARRAPASPAAPVAAEA